MVDIDALRKKFAGYSNILAHIEKMVWWNDQNGLERLDKLKINDDKQTFSFFADEDGSCHILLLQGLDDFFKGVHWKMKRIAQDKGPYEEGDD